MKAGALSESKLNRRNLACKPQVYSEFTSHLLINSAMQYNKVKIDNLDVFILFGISISYNTPTKTEMN